MARVAADASEEFGALLRRYRLEAGLTQEALAERAGLSAHGISDLERGARTRPYLATFDRLASALGLSDRQRAALHAKRRSANTVSWGPARPPQTVEVLPVAMSNFVGREIELQAVIEQIHDSRLQKTGGLGHRRYLLPQQPTKLVGRTVELGELHTRLQDDDTRLLTLTGPGGTGKTRLALALADEAVGAFSEGACFVDLTPLRDPDLVLPAIARE